MNNQAIKTQNFSDLEQLRAYHNERLIRLAYLTILGREADVSGLTHYLAGLRITISPEDFFAELRCSKESSVHFGNNQAIERLDRGRPKLKILLCNERFLFRFGVDRVLLLLGEGLKQRGHTINVMANRIDRKPVEAFAEKIIEVPSGEDGGYLNLNEFTADWLEKELPKIFSSGDWPDVVIIGGWPFFAAIPLFRAHGAKVIFLDCGAVPLDGMEGGQLITQEKLRAMRKSFLPKSNQIIAISKFIEKTQSKQDAGKLSNTTSIHLGADHMERGLWSVDTVENTSSTLTAIRNAKEAGYKVLLNLGRWESGNYKNSLALFDLIKIIHKEVADVVALVLSDGSDMDIPYELKKCIIPIGNPSDEELRKIMADADVGVSVSLWEGFNLPLAEMQWLGKPVVVFNKGAHPEVVAHPWFLADDPAQMASKLIACLQNRGLQQVEHKSAIERFRANFSWEQVVDSYERDLLTLMSSPAISEYSYLQVLVDVTNSAHDPANSGVIRVTRSLCRALQAWCEPIFVLWDQSISSYVFPTIAEYVQLGAFNGPKKFEYHVTSPNQSRIKLTDRFTIRCEPGDSWLLLPETTMEQNGKNIRAFAQTLDLQIGVVFYDAIPLIRPDLCKDKTILENHSFYMAGLAKCDMIFPISDFSGQCLADYWHEKNIPDTKILPVLLPGEFSAGSRVTLPSLFDSNRVNILCVSTIEPRKNHRTLLDALNLLSEKHPDIDWSLTLVGNRYAGGDDLAQMVEAACAQNFRIRWLGIADDNTLHELYETCSFTVYPSFIEGYGMPIVESLWHGKPCICYEQGVMSELAKDGGCFTTDVLNAEKLSEAIYTMSTNRVTYDLLSQQAVARTIKNWEEYAQEMLVHMAKQAMCKNEA